MAALDPTAIKQDAAEVLASATEVGAVLEALPLPELAKTWIAKVLTVLADVQNFLGANPTGLPAEIKADVTQALNGAEEVAAVLEALPVPAEAKTWIGDAVTVLKDAQAFLSES